MPGALEAVAVRVALERARDRRMDRRDEGRLRRQEAKGLSRVSYIAWSGLGSGLNDQSQKMTVAERAMAEQKAIGQRAKRVATLGTSLRRPALIPLRVGRYERSVEV